MTARLSLLISLAALPACYTPKIQDGMFTCSPVSPCPRGFTCAGGFCARGGAVDLGGDGATTAVLFSGLLGDLDLTGQSGTLEIDTESGKMSLGASVIVEEGAAGFAKVSQTGGPSASVFAFKRLVLPSTVTVQPSSRSMSALHQ
jgi:hypothetical protein